MTPWLLEKWVKDPEAHVLNLLSPILHWDEGDRRKLEIASESDECVPMETGRRYAKTSGE
jgi:hypothetical protein